MTIEKPFTNVTFIRDARKKLLKGLNATANAVGCTLGPRGKTVLIQQPDGSMIVTKDGVTVSKSINFSDPLEQMGSRLIQESAQRTNELAGDGTTTATILTQSLVNDCDKFTIAGNSSFSMKNGITTGVAHVLARLKVIKNDVTSNIDVKNVATISANGSTQIGELIALAISKVSNDGIITIEDGKGIDTTVDIVDGMQLNRGYLSSYFINNKEKMIVEYDNCRVLVTNEKISDLSDIIDLLNAMIASKESLLIIADDVNETAMQTLVLNRSKANLPVVAIKAPGFGDNRNELLSDICALIGATLIGRFNGTSLKSVKRDQLGTCKKILVSKSSTTLIGGSSNSLSDHITELKVQISDVSLSYERLSIIRSRIASLVNGVAIIRVGGSTELEMHERRDRVEDALNATRAAIEEGIVPGGGMALYKASQDVMTLSPRAGERDVDAFTAGLKIVKNACEAPFKRIIENAGKSFESLKEKIPPHEHFGYDARNETFVNMLENGIIDPVKVTRFALEHASSVAITYLSMDAVVHSENVDSREVE